MTPSVKIFPFEDGKPAKITTDRVNRFLETLKAAGYGCAIFDREFKPGKFVVKVDAVNGYSVAWLKLGGLREVAA